MVEIRLADRKRAAAMKLHPKNREEVEALTGVSEEVVMAAMSQHVERLYECLVNGEPVCLLGLHSNTVSLLFGANVETLPISFYKKSREVVEELARSRSLSGHIYCKNDFSLRWAKFLGFTIKEAEPYGVKNELFHSFYMEVNKNVS